MISKHVELIKRVIECLTEMNLKYFLVGATARNLLFEKKKLQGIRRTNDWDFAVHVKNWEEYDQLIQALLQKGFLSGTSKHNLISDHLIIDIVPFGGVADRFGDVKFPKPSDNVLSVIGFEDFLKITEEVKLNDIVLRIGSYEALLGSKILAWNDRKSEDDASDIKTLLEKYEFLSREDFYQEIGEEEFPLSGDSFDFDYAKAFLAGRSLSRVLSKASKIKIVEIVDSWIAVEEPEIVRKWVSDLDHWEERIHHEKTGLVYFRDGLNS